MNKRDFCRVENSRCSKVQKEEATRRAKERNAANPTTELYSQATAINSQ